MSCYPLRWTPVSNVGNDRWLQILNESKLPPETITKVASGLLMHPKELPTKQAQLLQYVRFSADSVLHRIAASNAISILNRTGFSFQGIPLINVKIPYADLSHTILNRTIFTGADLTGVNFTSSSFIGTIFNDTDMGQVNFGIELLGHASPVIKMAHLSDQKSLLTLDQRGLYLWDVDTKRLLMKEDSEDQRFWNGLSLETFLLISPDEKFFLRAYYDVKSDRWMLDIVDARSLTIVKQECLAGVEDSDLDYGELKLIASTAKDQYLLAYGNRVEFWELTQDNNDVPKFVCKDKDRKLFEHGIRRASYNAATNQLAVCRSDSLELFSLPDFQSPKKWEVQNMQRGGYIEGVAFSPGADALLIAYGDQLLKWNIEQNKTETLFIEEGLAPSEDMHIPATIRWVKLLPKTTHIAYQVSWGTDSVKVCIRDIVHPSEVILNRPSRTNVDLHGDKAILCNGHFIEVAPLKNVSAEDQPTLENIIDIQFVPKSNEILILTREGTLHRLSVLTGQHSSLNSVRVLKEHHFKERPFFSREWANCERRNKEHKLDYACAFSANGDYLIGEYRDEGKGNGHVCISTLKTGEIHSLTEKPYLAYAVSKDNRFIIFLNQEGVELWDIDKKERIGFARIPVDTTQLCFNIAVSPEVYPVANVIIGEYLTANLWKINWQKEMFPAKRIYNFTYSLLDSFNENVRFSGSKLFFKDKENHLSQYNMKTKETKSLPYCKDRSLFSQFDVSDDGKYLVGSTSLGLALWDIDNEKWSDTTNVTSDHVRISSDGRFVASWWDTKLNVYEIVDGGHFKTLWQNPQHLEMARVSSKNVKNLSPLNALLLQKVSINI